MVWVFDISVLTKWHLKMEHRNTVNLSKMDKKKEKETCFLCEKEGDHKNII